MGTKKARLSVQADIVEMVKCPFVLSDDKKQPIKAYRKLLNHLISNKLPN